MSDEDVEINGTEDGVERKMSDSADVIETNEVAEDVESISRIIAYSIFFYETALQSSLAEAKNSYYEFKILLEASESKLDEDQLSHLESLRLDYEFQKNNLHQRVLDFNESLHARFAV